MKLSVRDGRREDQKRLASSRRTDQTAPSSMDGHALSAITADSIRVVIVVLFPFSFFPSEASTTNIAGVTRRRKDGVT